MTHIISILIYLETRQNGFHTAKKLHLKIQQIFGVLNNDFLVPGSQMIMYKRKRMPKTYRDVVA